MWKAVDISTELSPENYSVIVLNAVPTSIQQKDLSLYLERGGSILSVNGSSASLLGSSVKQRSFTSLTPDRFPKFASNDILDVFSDGLVDKDFKRGTLELSSDTLSIVSLGKGTLASIPFAIDSLIQDTRSRRKNFYFRKERLPSEVVSTVSKGTLRQFVASVLEFLHHQRTLPFVHKWYYPDAAQTIFTFRVDSDQGSEEEVTQLFTLCKKYSVPTMWFLDTKSHERWLSRFKEFQGQEIGIHCYEHDTYKSLRDNLANFSKAAEMLNHYGIKPTGIASPYGTWNESVALAFEQLGMSFSSEFSLDYDDVPFYPIVNGRNSPVLQIPIHPICVGSMLRSQFTNQEMIQYFINAIDRKIAEREPICLYHHPTHHHWDVFEELFSYLRRKNIKAMSYSEYAQWWKTRSGVVTEILYDETHRQLKISPHTPTGVYWRISLPEGNEAIVKSQDVVALDSLATQQNNAVVFIPKDLRRARRFDFRHPLLNILDSWNKRTQ